MYIKCKPIGVQCGITQYMYDMITVVLIYRYCIYPHVDERERDAAEIQGLENVADKTFLRTEIKTVGKETKSESVEITSDKRIISSSMEVETEAKRRRLEGPFGKHVKENKLDILLVLQEKNSQSLSHSPYPDFVNACMDVEDKNRESVFSAPTSKPSLPETFPNAKLKQDGTTKKEKTLLIHQSGEILPEQKHPKEMIKEGPMKKTSDKLHVKSPQKSRLSPSKAKQKTDSPCVKSPIKPLPSKKSVMPQVTFSKPKSIKTVKAKKCSPRKISKIKSPTKASSSSQMNPNVGEASLKSENMPKLIIKPVRLEKSLRSEYSVLEIPADCSDVSVMGIANIKQETSQFPTDEAKPKKKKKKKESDNDVAESPHNSTQQVITSTSSTHMFGEVHSINKVTDTVKKKKKKHKEKDRGKNKKKVNQKVSWLCACPNRLKVPMTPKPIFSESTLRTVNN